MSQQHKQTPLPPPNGQALVEYALILVLVIIGFGLALAATGPTIANVFSNTVFNLVNQEQTKIPTLTNGTRISPPDVAAFWSTVTAVALYTPQEIPLPTSTQAIPTSTPTPGSPPPPTNTFTATPITPTATPTATFTATDLAVQIPWTDTADNKVVWRLDEINPLGPEDWYAKYYNDRYQQGTIFLQGFNGNLDASKKQLISFNWGSGGPLSGGPVDNFSSMWTRTITLQKDTQLTFTSSMVDDGMRVWITGGSFGSAPGCSSKYKGDGQPYSLGDAQVGFDPLKPVDAVNKISTECLIFEDWKDGTGTGKFLTSGFSPITRTVPKGTYVIRVDHQEGTGGAGAILSITSNSNYNNPDDTLVDGSGNAVAGSNGNCDWGNPTGLEKFADTASKLWDSYEPDSKFVGQRRCFLEFRGSIEIIPSVVNPTLTFWDLWDFTPNTSAWVEIAEYKTDRTQLVWDRYPLHSGDTFNYNWTYQTVAIPAKYSGKKIALRYGIENRSSTASSRWWVDTIKIDTVTRKTFSTLMNYTDKSIQGWNLDDPAQKADFITSGSWGLTSENATGGKGFAWHESPTGSFYNKVNSSRLGDTSNKNYRIHSLEFNGFVDLDAATVDIAGDTGDPELVFYQTYDLANLTGLEIQYTTDPYSAGDGASWSTIGTPIIARTNNTTTSLSVAEEKRINLKAVGDAVFVSKGNRKFRLRFAMLVDVNSTANKNGWWIDDISIQRVDRPRFTPYPFLDTMETAASDAAWLSLGTWAREAGGQNPASGTTGYSFTDSPGVNYQNNDVSVLELRYPMDLRADTVTNPRSPKCTLVTGCEPVANQDKAAVNPVMSFWWEHELGSNDSFFVEWKLKTDSATSWQVLWAYRDGMQTVGTSQRVATRISKAWERVEIDMKPIMSALANNPGADNEDDIVLRFNLTSDGNGNGPGVWIDNVQITERVETVWYLWPTSETRTDAAGKAIAPGSGLTYINSGEDINVYPPEWYLGGNWSSISWEEHDGLYGFHDSAVTNNVTQSKAEVGSGDSNIANTQRDSFNALEMNTTFDLRGVNATERPILYFWSRYNVSAGSTISVQIATEKTTPTTTSCIGGYFQCYEKLYGWNEWQTVWSVTGEKANFAWNREQVNLVPYAKNGATPGARIRIRFVMDALDQTNDRDGWYLDQFALTYYSERRITVNASNTFFDNATDMGNWISEGQWGLDPQLYRGGGGTPISLGDSWTVQYWNFNTSARNTLCNKISAGSNNTDKFETCIRKFFEPGSTTAATATDANKTDQAQSLTGSYHQINTTGVPRDSFGVELEIFHEWGLSGPFGYTDAFAGRWELVTNTVGAPGAAKGKITFIMASDDGARLRYINEQATNQKTTACAVTAPTTCGNVWNVIDNFTAHGRLVDVGSAFLGPAGTGNNTSGKYRFILEYYDKSGDSTITLSTGADTYSFSDSPKQGSGTGFPEVTAIRKASSSLVLNGVLDLTTAVSPYLTYYTYYELGGTARVEVSVDGGFTWTQVGLRGQVDNSKWQTVTWPTGTDWYVEMWNDQDLDYTGSSTPNFTTTTPTLDFNWGTGIVYNSRADDLSLRFRRKVSLTTIDRLNLSTTADDGVRLWIYRDGVETPNFPSTTGCATAGSPAYLRSGAPTSNGGAAVYTSTCLLIDNWKAQGSTYMETTFQPTVAGTYVIQLDYFEAGGGANVTLDVSPSNFQLPSYTNTWMPANGDWQFKVHDLTPYQGQRVGLRFRLDRLGVTSTNEVTQSPYNYLDSWWITEISVLSN